MMDHRRLVRLLSLGLLTGVAASLAGCQRPSPGKQSAPRVMPATVERSETVDDARYLSSIRRILTTHGCSSGSCHGQFKGGGLQFLSVDPKHKGDYDAVLERIDRKNPRESLLIKKALGEVPHNGGRNLREDQCDTKKLLAWIGNAPEPECTEQTVVRDVERFKREVAPALIHMGCATSECHGAPGGLVRVKLDLFPLVSTPADPAAALRSFERTGPNPIYVWRSRIIQAALANSAPHVKKVDESSCAYRRVYGFIAGAPESTCDLDKPMPKLPSVQDLAKVVMPGLARRGCLELSCHQSGAGDMSLFPPEVDALAPMHNFLALSARVEDFKKPEESTLMRTVRNEEPHGGGKRLGGKGDCLDEMLISWIGGKPVKTCEPPPLPTYARFVKEIQAVLDRMTCSQHACHGESIPHYKLIAFAKTEADLRLNYEQTIRQIDRDFMPFSPIQLRMRQPCAYAIVGAWIENKPRPECVMQDPAPGIFPKVTPRPGQLTHPKVNPGPPPPLKKT